MATEEDYQRMGVWACVKDPDQNIDRRKCTRQVPMEVLCFGLPRTGTQSMQEALSILGYPTYHYSSIFRNCRDGDMWKEALRAKFKGKGKFGKEDFDQLLGHVSATVDAPSVLFWEELMEYYPDAKIILVERDIEKWFNSISILLEGVLNPFGRYVLQYTDPGYYARIGGCGMSWMEALCGSMDLQTAKSNARGAYESTTSACGPLCPGRECWSLSLVKAGSHFASSWTNLCRAWSFLVETKHIRSRRA